MSKKTKQPTKNLPNKAELAFKEMIKNPTIAKGKILEKVGYKASVVKNPKIVTNTKTFQALLEQYLPEKHLAKRHREFLDAERIIRTYKKGDLVSETEETDPSAVKALDMAYKLKGKYNSESEGNKTLIINISGESASRYNVSPTPRIHEQDMSHGVGGTPTPEN